MIRSLISGFGNRLTSWVKGSIHSSYSANTLAYNGSTFACQLSDCSVHTSTDGITWVRKGDYEDFYAISATYSSSTLIMVGYNTSTLVPAIFTSTDGTTWTSRSVSTAFGTTAFIRDICWSGTYLVAVSTEGHIATSSGTGSSWTQRAKTNAQFTGVAFGGGIYIAAGWGEIWRSTNGTTWTNVTGMNPYITTQGASYGNGLFVIVGSSGNIITSPDGITWTRRTSSFGNTTINSITYGDGKFVIVGDLGKIATSTDGITWSLSDSPVTTQLDKVIYGADKFVAVGTSRVLITSPTGL